MPVGEIYFDLILDKGCLDSLLLSDFNNNTYNFEKVLKQTTVLLSNSGIIVFYSIGTPELLIKLIKESKYIEYNNLTIEYEEINGNFCFKLI